jgi:hypothetical protein
MTVKEYLNEVKVERSFEDEEENKKVDWIKKFKKEREAELLKKKKGEEYSELTPSEKARLDKMIGYRRAGKLDKARFEKMESENVDPFTRRLVKDIKEKYSRVPEFGIEKAVRAVLELIDNQNLSRKGKQTVASKIVSYFEGKAKLAKEEFFIVLSKAIKHFKFKDNGKTKKKVS